MALPWQFASLATIQSIYWDDNFAALGALTPIPCSVTGTNTLALAPLANTPTVVSYANYSLFTGIVSVTNSGAVTAQVGSLAALNVYKDTFAGPVLLTGGELVANTAIGLLYDSALNTGAGGFHLQYLSANATVKSLQIGNTISTITDARSTVASITWTSIVPQASQDHAVTLTGCSVGDVVMIGPPASVTAGIVVTGYIPNAGTVNVRAANITGSTITPAAANYRVASMRFSP